ncbi:DEAD/DEAH box helicase [Microbacterium sp.]|uniref:DEAD/DEAH box helicase n=1 Tax=Microbacterium sp. TaxID=51671 RepID=UPI00281230BB|nr:DEAD/DEAH box helicase [Microbacterium sp.]
MTPLRPGIRTLRQLAGDGGYERGADYARRGRVLTTEWDAAAQLLLGEVQGAEPEPYWCSIRFRDGDIVGTACSCPMQYACKHIVATLLVGTAEEPEPAPPVGPSWRSLLFAPAAPASAPIPLAVGIEVRIRPPRSPQHWAAPAAHAASPYDLRRPEGEILLAVRPLMRSPATGRWIQGDARWDTVRRSSGRFTPEQAQWFTDFLGIARDSLLSGTAGDWIVLDRVQSPLLWHHLRALPALGMPLEPTQRHTTVRLAESASAALELSPSDGGGITVGVDVRIDDERVPAESVHVIGGSGLYLIEVGAQRLDVTLAPVALAPAVRAAIVAAQPVVVPAADREAFLATAYPALARQTEIRATGMNLPPIATAEPVLSVRFHPDDRVEYHFAWEYSGHGHVPLAPGGEPFRDPDAEARRLRDIEAVWGAAIRHPFHPTGALQGIEAAEWAAKVLTAFEDSDVRVVVTGRRKDYRELTAAPEISVSTVESTDPDWFDLGVVVTIDGRTIPFTPLFTALSLGRKKMLLSDGGYFSLAHPALQRLRDLIDEAAGLAEWETTPRISRYQTTLWEEFEDLADHAEPALAWRALAEGLRDVETIPPTPEPRMLQAQLRPYQKQGFDWLAFLWRHRLGGILADDMGLGKTLQLLALIAHAVEQGSAKPFLVIAPTSVMATWRSEAARFTPGLRVRVIDSTFARRDHSVADAAAGADLIVTSYTLARLDDEQFQAVEWAGLILDEAQFVKNNATRLHRVIADLKSVVTIAVTGTPLENSLTDLWSLLSLAAPGLFPSARKFRQDYVQPIEKGKVPENQEGGAYRRARLDRLRRRIRPLMLRRTKDLVAADLPEKQVQELIVELSPAHGARYDTVLQRERQKVLGLLADLDRNRFIVFRSLTMLRMMALSPSLVDPDAAIPSRKLDVLLEHIDELRAEGHRALVFSQFTSFLDLAEERLTAAGIAHVRLDGSTRRRAEVVDGFRAGEQPVFLISLKAGGFGLTVTEADYVFLLDPWWNPAAESQAVDRVHRIGQTRRVFVYRLIAAGTIEEKVVALQQRKARLFSAVVDDDALFSQSLTADDIRALLES